MKRIKGALSKQTKMNHQNNNDKQLKGSIFKLPEVLFSVKNCYHPLSELSAPSL